VLRETRPDLPQLKPPAARKGRLGLYAALAAVAGVTVFFCVQATSGPGHPLVDIPSPPAVSAVAPADPSAVASGTASAPGTSSGRTAGSASPSQPSAQPAVSLGPVAGGQYAGQVELSMTGSQLESWNQTKSFCTESDWGVADGSVFTDSSNDAVLATTGKPGSCVGLVSPESFSSAVIEAYAYFPPLPGRSGTIADWSSVWLTNQANWPAAGELDAVEAEPATGVNAVAWHWGSAGAEQSVSTDGLAADGTLPKSGPNLTPGWHVVDIAYAQGFFAVYYDGRLFTTMSADIITGAPLNLLITTSVTPDNGEVEQQIGGPPVNSDSQPAGLAVKYVKVWAFK
jgi:hypothetical protein